MTKERKQDRHKKDNRVCAQCSVMMDDTAKQ